MGKTVCIYIRFAQLAPSHPVDGASEEIQPTPTAKRRRMRLWREAPQEPAPGDGPPVCVCRSISGIPLQGTFKRPVTAARCTVSLPAGASPRLGDPCVVSKDHHGSLITF